MGQVVTRPGERCYIGHFHRSIEDVIECERYHSNRMREADQMNTMEYMMTGGQNVRYNPYQRDNPPPNPHPNYADQPPTYSRQNYGGQSPTDQPGNRNQQQSRNANYGGQSSHGQPNDGNRPQYGQQNNRGQTQNSQPGDRNSYTGRNKTNDKKNEKSDSSQGFWSRWFGPSDYVCPLHHQHKTMEEASECMRNLEARGKENHLQRMNEKYNRGERNGLHHDSARVHTQGPIIEEVE